MTTEAAATDSTRYLDRVGYQLVLASTLASTLGLVIAQFLDDLGDGIAAQLLGGEATLFNNRVEFTGATDLAWGGGFVLCLIVGLFALFSYPTQRDHDVPRLVLLWTLLHVLRQALTQAAFAPFAEDGQLAKAFHTFDMQPGLDVVIAVGAGVGLLLIALASAAAFLAYTPHRRLVASSRGRLLFVLWIALIPAVASVFLAIPFFLPDSEGLVLPGLPLAALMFVATLLAAPGTTVVQGPEYERTTKWPWGLAVVLVVIMIFFLSVLQGGVGLDPRTWSAGQ